MPADSGTDFVTKIPALSDDADIQEALKLFLYGSADNATAGIGTLTATDGTEGLAGHLNTMKADTAAKLPLTGGTVTGSIVLSTAPTIGNHLTNKTYVDSYFPVSTDNAIPKFHLTGGVLQNTGLLIDDSNNLTIPGNITSVTNITVNGTSTLNGTTTVDGGELNVTRVGDSTHTYIDVLGDANYQKYIRFWTGGTRRWEIGQSSETETGTSNAGSNFILNKFTDAGAGSTAIKINRNSGDVEVLSTTASTSTSTGALTVDGGLGVAGVAYIGSNLDIGGAITDVGNITSTGNFLTTGQVKSTGSNFHLDRIGDASGAVIYADSDTGQVSQLSLRGPSGTPSWNIRKDASDNLGILDGGTNRLTVDGTTGDVRIYNDLDVDINLNVDGQITAASGSLATPGISFSGDTNTGIYNASNGEVDISCNGSQAAYFSSTGIRAASGSAATPSISFISDTNTGLYWIGTDAVGISTAGSLQLRVDTAGIDVTGVITATSVVRASAGSAGTPAYSFTGDTNTGMYWIGADAVGVTTGGSLQLRIDTAGIDVTGVITATSVVRASAGSAGTPAYSFTGDTNTGMYWIAADAVGISTAGSLQLRVDTAGIDVTGTITSTGAITGDSAITAKGGLNSGESTTAAARAVVISAAAGYSTQVNFRRGSGDRWIWRCNAGNQLELLAYNSSGVYQRVAAYFVQDSGIFYSKPTYDNSTTTGANVNITSAGQFRYSTSSIRVKDNVVTASLQDSQNLIESLRPVRFTSKCEDDDQSLVQWGFIAEEVDLVDKSITVYGENDEPVSLQYDRVVPALVSVVQDQVQRLKDQQDQLDQQEQRLAALEAMLV